jgi:transcriptional regulator
LEPIAAPVTDVFETFVAGDVRDLIAEYPLAWVCATVGDMASASLLPLLGEYGPDGELTHLLGHMARRNELFAALSNAPRASLLFQGPQAYVSPEHAGRRDWGPTWNYAQLRIDADIEFLPAETAMSVDVLTAAMERGRDAPWEKSEIAPRYDAMLRAIVAFRARVVRVRGRFKLGQDEARPVFQNIVATHDDAALVRWMQRFDRTNA